MLSYKLHKDNHENFKYIGYLKDTAIVTCVHIGACVHKLKQRRKCVFYYRKYVFHCSNLVIFSVLKNNL